jgi:hypothetical protein
MKINYKAVIDYGFKVEPQTDDVYYDQYGYNWNIITLDLTKKIYLDWDQTTQLCEMIRIDNNRECNIMARLPIRDVAHLEEIIEFYGKL